MRNFTAGWSKKFILLLISVLVASLLGGCGGGDKNAGSGQEKEKKSEVKRLSIATASTAGAWYPLGGAYANMINKYVPGMEATAEVGAASIENVRKLNKGDVGLAFLQSDIAYDAYYGKNKFEQAKMDDIRALFATYGTVIQCISLADSGITSLDQAKGKKVGVGAPGSGTEGTSKAILEIYGLTYDDIDEQYISVPEMVTAAKDGNLDVIMANMPVPTGVFMDLGMTHKIRALPVEGQKQKEFLEKYPYFYPVIIPKGVYNGIDADVDTVAFRGTVYATTRMSEQEAYDICKAIWEHRSEWEKVHAVTNDIKLETALEGVPSPLHPGALKYYREKGLTIPDKLIPQK